MEKLKNQEYICYCDKVTINDIITAIENGANSLREIIDYTGAMRSPNCKVNNPKGVCCSSDIIQILKNYEMLKVL